MSPSFANRRLAADAFEARIEDAIVRPGDLYDLDVGPSSAAAADASRQVARKMTETGYKSLFLPYGEVEAFGGVVEYVMRWLDAAALRPAWKAAERDMRQGRLF